MIFKQKVFKEVIAKTVAFETMKIVMVGHSASTTQDDEHLKLHVICCG
jgi:hypothetical protein